MLKSLTIQNQVCTPPQEFASRVLVILVCILSYVQNISAQDIHFTQYYQSPTNLNPALTGLFDGDYRFTAIQRTQWRSVTRPYSTFGLSAEATEIFQKIRANNIESNSINGLHAGFGYYRDIAGDSRLKSDVFQLNLSFRLPINVAGATLHIAVSPGITQMSIDYSNLRFDQQWNGLQYDPGLGNTEQFARSSRGYLNLNSGLALQKKWNNNRTLNAGLAVFNLNNPKQSFFDDGYVKLDTRLTAFAQYKFDVKNNWSLEPMMLWMRQGTYNELLFGGLGYYKLSEKAWNNSALYAGVAGRARDAGNLIAGIIYQDWNVGLSYDINTSNLRPASNGRGGFEISAVYIIPTKKILKPHVFCPDYM